MLNSFPLPDLGEGLTEAGIVAWLVAEGDPIALDQPMVEVETAKSTVEIPAPFAGIVRRTFGTSGQTLSVGSVLVEIESEGAPRSSADTTGDSGVASTTAPESSGEERPLIGFGAGPTRSAARRRPAARPAAAHAVPAGSTTTSPTATAPAKAEAATPASHNRTPGLAAPGRVRVASPLLRKIAATAGISLSEIVGSGPGGLITRTDVESAIAAPATPMPELGAVGTAATQTDRRTGLSVARTEPLGIFRTAVASTLGKSRSEIPEATVWVDVDATKLVKLRRTLAADAALRGEKAPSFTAIFGYFALSALRDFPALAASFDAEARAIRHYDGVNLGFAADTPRGLVVPSVERAEGLSLGELAREMARLTIAAREGSTTPAELTRGTFTVNNYGVFGVDGSAAIINYPEAAILGFGRIIERPWVVKGKITARKIMQVSLVFDHRLCDGGVAGGFLRRIADAIESPVPTLLR